MQEDKIEKSTDSVNQITPTIPDKSADAINQISSTMKELADYLVSTKSQIQFCMEFANLVRADFHTKINKGEVSFVSLPMKSEESADKLTFLSKWMSRGKPAAKPMPSQNPQSTANYSRILSNLGGVSKGLEKIGQGFKLINVIREDHKKIVKNPYQWLLKNHKRLGSLIDNNDLNEFMAACTRYVTANETIADLSEELKNHLPQDDPPHIKAKKSAALSSLPTFGFQYPSRIRLLFKSLIAAVENKEKLELTSSEISISKNSRLAKLTPEVSLLDSLRSIESFLGEKLRFMEGKSDTYDPYLTSNFANKRPIKSAKEVFSKETTSASIGKIKEEVGTSGTDTLDQDSSVSAKAGI